MAVIDDRIYHPTEALILRNPRRHHRVALRVEHWQLRSQIGISSARHIYYVAGNNNTQVHKLDTTTHESEIAKILTFAPRCLVAKNGWICCGGESGEFVAFPMNEGGASSDGSSGDDNPDSAIWNSVRAELIGNRALNDFRDQLHSDIRSRTGLEITYDDYDDNAPPPLVPAIDAESNSDSKSLVAQSKSFGKDRVNCITLWFPPQSKSGRYDGAYLKSVAVLANNDHNITVVSLEDQQAVEQIDCPDCVNRALISPDGRLLVAICDDPYLYVHERVQKDSASTGVFSRRDHDYEWKLCARFALKSQQKDDRSDQRGSFAACFSNTGRFLAVGTQYGFISVFDTALFLEPGRDPLVTCFTSSRPKEDVGAIRDMAFCPGPFDLLAWTEHRGRVGVADVRSNYVSRQILKLDMADDYDQIIVTEKCSIDPRLLQRSDRGDARTAWRAPIAFQAPLDAEETRVLEALSAHRRQRDRIAGRGNTSVGSESRLMDRLTESRLLDRYHSRAVAGRDASARDAAARDLAANREHRNSSRVSDLIAELFEYRMRIRDWSNHVREQVREQQLFSREVGVDEAAARRIRALSQMNNSAVFGQPDPGIERLIAGEVDYHNMTNNVSTHQTFDFAAASNVNNSYEPGQGGSTGERAREYLNSVWGTMLRQRDMETETTGRLNRNTGRMAERAAALGRIEREPDDTAGLAWSEDGSMLIVGTEDGFYEFHINTFSRKVFPSITMR